MEFTDIANLFATRKQQYVATAADALARKTRELWANGPIMESAPFEMVREGLKLGTRLAKRPARTKDCYGYWLDSASRMVARLRGSEFKDQFYEEFFDYFPDRVESCAFGSSSMRDLLNVRVYSLVDGRVAMIRTMGKYGAREEVFIYEGEQLIRIDVHAVPHDDTPESHQVMLTYTPTGALDRIWQCFEGGRVVEVYPVDEA